MRGPGGLDDRYDFSCIRGFLTILEYEGSYAPDKPHRIFLQEKNLVVSCARRIMSRLMAGAVTDEYGIPASVALYDATHPNYPAFQVTNPSQLFVTQMRWGTGGYVPNNPTVPVAPSLSDEQLKEPIADPAFKLADVDYPDSYSARFRTILGEDEANGNGIGEIGLFTAGGLLFARKTFGILSKIDRYSYEFRWTIYF